jgi:peroxiredoxin
MKTLIFLFFGFLTFKAGALSPEERKNLFTESIQKLKGTGIEKQVPQVGQSFPDASIGDKKVSDWVKVRPLLLVVYRGGWCPYCVKQLKDLQANLQRFKDNNVSIVAISLETEKEVRKTRSKNNLSLTLISDKDGAILRKVGLIFRVDDKVAQEYRALGINFAASQGNSYQELPVPATYLIGKDMKVRYGYIDADYTKRPSVEDIFKSL